VRVECVKQPYKAASREPASRSGLSSDFVNRTLGCCSRLLVCADDVNLLGDNIDIIKKNTQTSIDASKEVGLEVNTEET
jgi:hypothetical protein